MNEKQKWCSDEFSKKVREITGNLGISLEERNKERKNLPEEKAVGMLGECQLH